VIAVNRDDGRKVTFHVLTNLRSDVTRQVQNETKRRILHAFVKLALRHSFMLQARHAGNPARYAVDLVTP
jgi:hypothetical protein